jgi:hypothetical protein
MNQKYSINILALFNFHVVLVKKNDLKICLFWYKALIEDFFYGLVKKT